MHSANRKLLFGLSAFLIGWALLRESGQGDGATVRAGGPDSSQVLGGVPSGAEHDYDRDYDSFVQRLGEFRAGDDMALEPLRLAAGRLAHRHGRPDALAVTKYYAGLSRRERLLGLAAYDEFLDIRGRVEEHSGVGWDEDLEAYRLELRELVARVLPTADIVPAGHALALATRIEVKWLEFQDATDEMRTDLLTSAIRNARESIAIFDGAGMLTPQLQPLWLQGRLEILQGHDSLARQHFEECARLATRTRIDDYRERALLRLVRIARGSGDVERMRELLAQLAQFRSPENCWELAREHAMLLIHQDEAEHVAEFLLRYRPNDSQDMDVWRFALALARLRTGDYNAARELLRKMSQEESHQDSLLLQATLDLEQGDSAAVLAALDRPESQLPVLGERGRSRAAVMIGEAHLIEGRAEDALRALARGREIADTWEARLERQSSLEATSATVMGEWLGLHAVVLEARALLVLDRPFEAALLIERMHSARWRAESRQSPTDARPLGADDLRAWAANYEHGLVMWISGAKSGLAVHISPEGLAQGMEISASRKELKRASRRLRGALISDDVDGVTRLSNELASVLFPESLLESLVRAGPEDGRLLCLSHGEIERIPLEALQIYGKPLDELAAVLVLPELPAQLPGQLAHTESSWRLLGNPLDRNGIERLPAAGDELEDLRTRHPRAQTYTGQNFQRDAFTRAITSGDSLHIATHLVTSPDCASERFASVGLELSGGAVLCAQEIADLESAAALVVLTACETAEGLQLDARGLQGVSRAFLHSGVRDLLVTLWPIRDEAGRQFTSLFHEGLVAGLGPARAARRARRRLDEIGVSAADWAAFRILGRD